MFPSQQELVSNFAIFLEENPDANIALKGNFGTNNNGFLYEIEKIDFLLPKNNLILETLEKKKILATLKKNENQTFDYIIFHSEIFDFYEIIDLLDKYAIVGKIIFTTRYFHDESDIATFEIPEISFREYAEHFDEKIAIGEILKGNSNLEIIEGLAHQYLESGSFLQNIENSENVIPNFSEKIQMISEELFEKERGDFQNFIGSIAMNVSTLFKEDYIAKSMNLSRRKIRKYTELLLKYDIIRMIEPFSEDPEKELSRHSKMYFSDLSYYRGAMGQTYGLGNSKTSMMENFIFLELSRKLRDTHDIFFWKKKSGTEIAFVLKNRENNKLTPIEVGFSSPRNISQTMKSFYDSYGARVEYGMFLNEGKIFTSEFGGKSFLTLPFYTI
ncbi:hypothetical protein BLM37_00965 [Candidatus Gracilibacteria bacterium GN02-873]|nr:hypothetical protein BLM37_00965 [Candidatus Gracilibacteria bacterium GN02-873]